MEADEAQWQKSLTGAARSWQDTQRDSGTLWRGKALGQALSFAEMGDLELEFVRASVAECLKRSEKIGVKRPTARLVGVLFDLLINDDPYTCSCAEYALEQIAGTKSEVVLSVIERLIDLLTGPDSAVRPRAASILEEAMRYSPERVAGDVMDLLVRMLRDRDPDVCGRAKYILKRAVDARPVLAGELTGTLQDMLSDPCDAVRARAACLLEVIVTARPKAATAQMAEALVDRLGDPAGEVHRGAQYVLERMIDNRPEMCLHIAGLLDNLLDAQDAQMRACAIRILERVVQVDRKAVTGDRVRTLVELAQDHNLEVSMLSTYVLWRLADEFPDLVQQTRDQRPRSLAAAAA